MRLSRNGTVELQDIFKKTLKLAKIAGVGGPRRFEIRENGLNLLLPRALFVAIGLQALFALMLVHLETALFLEVAHGDKGLKLRREKGLRNTLAKPL